MNAPTTKVPEHEAIHARISDAILFGEMVPGQAVTLQGLADMIGSGMMPVRDAVRRLTSAGALRKLGNRRIEVPTIAAAELDELTFARCAVEPKIVEIAVEKAQSGLADQLLAIDKGVDAAIESGDVGSYLKQNYLFHFHLYRQSGAGILLTLTQGLWLRSGPSLRVVCGRFGTANLPDMHDETIAAIREGDAIRAAEAIRMDIQQGMDQIRKSLDLAPSNKAIDL